MKIKKAAGSNIVNHQHSPALAVLLAQLICFSSYHHAHWTPIEMGEV